MIKQIFIGNRLIDFQYNVGKKKKKKKKTPNRMNQFENCKYFQLLRGHIPLRTPCPYVLSSSLPSFQRQKNYNNSGTQASVTDWGGCKEIDMVKQTFNN